MFPLANELMHRQIASTIHRHTIDIDGNEQLNNFTIKHSPINSNSSNKNDTTISSINSNLRNMSPSYHHDDDKLIHSTVTHSVPVGAAPPPAEPKSKCVVAAKAHIAFAEKFN